MNVKEEVLLELRELAKLGVKSARPAIVLVQGKTNEEFEADRDNGMSITEIADLMMVIA